MWRVSLIWSATELRTERGITMVKTRRCKRRRAMIGLSIRCGFEMLAQAFANLLDGRLGGRHVVQRVQQHEVVYRAVETNCSDADSSLLELACIGCLLYTSPSPRDS